MVPRRLLMWFIVLALLKIICSQPFSAIVQNSIKDPVLCLLLSYLHDARQTHSICLSSAFRLKYMQSANKSEVFLHSDAGQAVNCTPVWQQFVIHIANRLLLKKIKKKGGESLSFTWYIGQKSTAYHKVIFFS